MAALVADTMSARAIPYQYIGEHYLYIGEYYLYIGDQYQYIGEHY